MNRSLCFSLLLCALCALMCFACAESEAPASEAFVGETFSLTLPEGVALMEDADSYAAAAAADYGDNIETAFVACDAAGIRLVTVTFITSDESADLAASNASEILLGSNDTVSERVCGVNKASAFSCSIDGVNYDFFYLSDGARLYCVTCAGLTDEEEDALVASFTAL